MENKIYLLFSNIFSDYVPVLDNIQLFSFINRAKPNKKTIKPSPLNAPKNTNGHSKMEVCAAFKCTHKRQCLNKQLALKSKPCKYCVKGRCSTSNKKRRYFLKYVGKEIIFNELSPVRRQFSFNGIFKVGKKRKTT